MNQQCINVLFLSSGNSTRSIMAEAILRRIGGERFRAFSAGSHPTGRVNPLALEQLRLRGYPTDGLASKCWSRFSREGAPPLGLLISVCGKVVDEQHPEWPGNPPQLYWNLPSPGSVEGSDAEVRAVFSGVCARLEEAMQDLIGLPLEELGQQEAMARLQEIGPR